VNTPVTLWIRGLDGRRGDRMVTEPNVSLAIQRLHATPCTKEDVLKRSTQKAEMLKVTIVGAVNLIAADLMRKSDPYVTVEREDMTDGVRIRTPAMNNELNPTWNHPGNVEGCIVDSCSLIFKVWDKDVLKKDDFLGQATMKLTRAHIGKEEPFFLPLQGPKGAEMSKLKVRISLADVTTNGDSSAPPTTAPSASPAAAAGAAKPGIVSGLSAMSGGAKHH